MVLRFKKHMIVAALFVILAAVATLMNSRPVAAQGPPDGLAVRIVNPLPVPTQGTSTVTGTVAATQSGTWKVGVNGTVGATQGGPWNVGVSGTSNVNVTNSVLPVSGTVQAQQNGAWNVGLTGTPTVNLNTSPSSPLIVAPVQPAVSQPFSAHFDYPGGTYSVPAGKQAVIELVAFQGYGLPNGYYFVLLTTTANSQSNVYTLGPTFVQHDSDNNKQPSETTACEFMPTLAPRSSFKGISPRLRPVGALGSRSLDSWSTIPSNQNPEAFQAFARMVERAAGKRGLTAIGGEADNPAATLRAQIRQRRAHQLDRAEQAVGGRYPQWRFRAPSPGRSGIHHIETAGRT